MQRPITYLSDEALLADCDVHVYRASGPGGQHRNRNNTAVRLHHRPTGITATAADLRSQGGNRKIALKRLKMNLAVRLRNPVSPEDEPLPDILAECLYKPKNTDTPRKLSIGKKDGRFWDVAAILLDMLESEKGRLSPVAEKLRISTGNLSSVLKSERHILAAAIKIRRQNGLRPLR